MIQIFFLTLFFEFVKIIINLFHFFPLYGILRKVFIIGVLYFALHGALLCASIGQEVWKQSSLFARRKKMISVVAWKSDLSKVWMKKTSKPHFNRKWKNDPCLSRHTRCLGYEEANLLEKDLVSPLVRWKLIVAAFLSRLVLLLLWWSRFVNVDVAVEVVSKLVLFLLSWRPFCPGRTFCQSKTFLSSWNQIFSILYHGIGEALKKLVFFRNYS